MGGSVMVPMTVPQGLRGVTSNHFCVLSGPPPSWALAEESPNYKTFVFSDICYLLLAHCFGGECHTNICRGSRLCTFWHYYSSLSWRMSPSVTSPIFFFSFFFSCVSELPKSTLSFMQQVADSKKGCRDCLALCPLLFCASVSMWGLGCCVYWVRQTRFVLQLCDGNPRLFWIIWEHCLAIGL